MFYCNLIYSNYFHFILKLKRNHVLNFLYLYKYLFDKVIVCCMICCTIYIYF
ncbi:hypothetical protein C1645_784586, partial [Glomus cerebriforme]